ncbi:MAG: hypothetical protein IT364_24530 [Candidatus Hydrogenedentes bacterium]|nr:hypothetical protein [Candidatus Hydrogenedentota bacterium]
MAYYYYIGPWVWDTSEAEPFFRAPSGCIGLIDIREDASIGGNGFFAFHEPMADAAGYTAFGDGTKLNSYVMTAQERADWETLTGESVADGATLLDALWDLLPLVPTYNRDLELWIGGHSLVRTRKFTGLGDPKWPKIQAVLRRSYSEIRADADALKVAVDKLRVADIAAANARTEKNVLLRTAAKLSEKMTPREAQALMSKQAEEHPRKWLGAQVAKYQVDWKEIAPKELQDKEPKKPTTTLNESFTASDGDTLAGDNTWAEVAGDWDIVSNRARVGGTGTVAAGRLESDLSSDDHYCQVTVTALGSGASTVICGPCVRFKSDAQTFFFCAPYQETDTLRTNKRITGTTTLLGTPPSITISIPESYKLEVDGTTLRSYQAGTLRETITDPTSIPYTRVGIVGYTATGTAECDDLVAEDLVAATGKPWSRNMNYAFHRSIGLGVV